MAPPLLGYWWYLRQRLNYPYIKHPKTEAEITQASSTGSHASILGWNVV